MRLDKFLANSGIGTRKEVKIILKKGKIKVNEKIVKDAKMQVDEIKDDVKIEGEKITYKPFVYIMMNKPSGVISATEDGKHKTVIDLLCEKYKNYKVFPVGRLDIDTEGLLLLTNDGVLAHNLLSPKKHVDKKYYVELKEPLTIEKKKILENGIKLEENFVTKKAKIEIIDKDKVKDKNKNIDINTNTNEVNSVFITISEGKFHQVKRMFKFVENEVLYLKRVKMGKLLLPENLKLGEYRELSEEEMNLILN